MILQKFEWCNAGIYNFLEIRLVEGKENNFQQWQCYVESVI